MKFLSTVLMLGAIAFAKKDIKDHEKATFKPNTLYSYNLVLHTTTTLLQDAPIDSQNSAGVKMKARLKFQANGENRVVGKLSDAFFGHINQLTKSYSDTNIKFEPYKAIEEPFEFTMSNGLVKNLSVSQSMEIKDVNLIKGLLVSIQYDTSNKNIIGNHNTLPKDKNANVAYNKMEFDVTGNCETYYSVNKVPVDVLQSMSRLYPFLNVDSYDQNLLKVIKTKNYGNCHESVAYNFGLPQGVGIADTSAIITRLTTQSMFIDSNNNTIYYSHGKDEIFTKPHMYYWNNQNGEVESAFELTLTSIETSSSLLKGPSDPCNVGNLQYSILMPSSKLVSKSKSASDILNIKANSSNDMDLTLKLLKEIDQDLQNHYELYQKDTLSKINFLINWMEKLNIQQLEQIHRTLVSQSLNPDQINDVFVDTIILVGTPSSYIYLKNLILKKELRGEMAAEAVSILHTTLKTPTKKLILDYFSLAFENDVKQEPYLNSSILLSVANLINMAHHSNSYGRLIPKHDKFISEIILSVFERELYVSINKQELDRAQVLIRSIGVLAHPDILKLFIPYLEMKIQCNSFLRQEMVMNLAQVAKIHYKKLRNILFNIYSNVGDNYEVRVAALLQLWKAQPTTAMVTSIAENSNSDPNIHVRSVIKSLIEYSANLGTDPKFERLSRLATSVLPILTSEEFGVQYSKKYLSNFFSGRHNINSFQALGLIGSEDSFIHKTIDYTSNYKRGGWMKYSKVHFAISSVSQFMECLKNILDDNKRTEGETHKFLADKIADLLNITGDTQESLIGNIYFKLMNQERMFAFTPQDFSDLKKYIDAASVKLKQGIHLNYTKFYNRENVEVIFPTMIGIPYFYKYENPIYIKAIGSVEAKEVVKQNPKSIIPDEIRIVGNVKLVYAYEYNGKVGFYCPFADAYITTGVLRKFQLNLPINMDTEVIMSGPKLKVHMNMDDNAFKILQKSLVVYTSIREYNDITVPMQHKNTKFMEKFNHMKKQTIGDKTTGISIEVEVPSSYSRYKYGLDDIMSSIWEMGKEKFNANFTHNGLINLSLLNIFDTSMYEYDSYSVSYLPNLSHNKNMTLVIAYYDQHVNKSNNRVWSTQEVLSNLDLEDNIDSVAREKEMVNLVSSGINYPKVTMLDVAVEFVGDKPSYFAATIARAKDNHKGKTQALLHLDAKTVDGREIVCNASLSNIMSNPRLFKIKESLNSDLKSDTDVYVRLEEKLQNNSCLKKVGLSFEINSKQSPQFKEYLNTFMGQITNGDNLMGDWDTAMDWANILDLLNLNFKFENFDDCVTSNNTLNVNESTFFNYDITDGFNANIRFFPVENEMVAYLLPYYFVPIVHKFIETIIGINIKDTTYDAFMSELYGKQFMLTCAIDENKIRTFANKEYFYKTDNCWHVAMVNGSRNIGYHQRETSPDKSTVLVREIGGAKELRIYYQNRRGDSIIVEVNRTNELYVNGQLISIPKDDVYIVTSVDGIDIILKMYYIYEKELMINIDDQSLVVITNGKSVIIKGQIGYKNTSRGLCGTMSGDKFYDLATPDNCFLGENRLFGASWAIIDDSQCSDEFKNLHLKEKMQICVPKTLVAPNINWNIKKQYSESSFEEDDNDMPAITSKVFQSNGSCDVQKVTQINEINGELCITTKPLNACDEKCNTSGETKILVEVVCISSKSDINAVKRMIKEARILQLLINTYKSYRMQTYIVPKNCYT